MRHWNFLRRFFYLLSAWPIIGKKKKGERNLPPAYNPIWLDFHLAVSRERLGLSLSPWLQWPMKIADPRENTTISQSGTPLLDLDVCPIWSHRDSLFVVSNSGRTWIGKKYWFALGESEPFAVKADGRTYLDVMFWSSETGTCLCWAPLLVFHEVQHITEIHIPIGNSWCPVGGRSMSF